VSDTFLFWLFLAILIGIFRWIFAEAKAASNRSKKNAAVYAERMHEIQTESEKRALDLIAEFPDINDEGLALMMRDELMNNRIQGQEWYRWATPDTVARMRRTLAVTIERKRRKRASLK
jgi:hypothetical protein